LTKVFIDDLTALAMSGGHQLNKLQVEIEDMPLPLIHSIAVLFSTTLFSANPTRWPTLRTLVLKGVDIDGFEFIAFLSRQSSISEVGLSNVP